MGLRPRASDLASRRDAPIGFARTTSIARPGEVGDPWLVLHLLGDGLVAFEPIGGINSTLVPDLATSIPTPTDGDKTYTFELRAGIRYSNGEVVAPGDFRRALERGFGMSSFVADYYGGLVGGEACENEPETCDLSEGIETYDVTRTITFHLVAPDPEFLYKLTLPPAYPVPPSVPDEEQLTSGVPGTGPYMLEAPMTSEALTLVRNPHFRVWSPAAQPDGYVDRIEWSFGVGYEAQVEAVAAGDADFALDAWISEGLAENLVRFPAQVHISSTAGTWFVVLNTEAPPFDNVEVRRAVNLALDRDRVAQIAAQVLGGGVLSPLPTCQTIPPNFPGYEPYCPYTMDPGPEGEGSWTAPDLEEAQRLVDRSGTARDAGRVRVRQRRLETCGAEPRGIHGRTARGPRLPREREGRPAERHLSPGTRVPDGGDWMGPPLPGRIGLHRQPAQVRRNLPSHSARGSATRRSMR